MTAKQTPLARAQELNGRIQAVAERDDSEDYWRENLERIAELCTDMQAALLEAQLEASLPLQQQDAAPSTGASTVDVARETERKSK